MYHRPSDDHFLVKYARKKFWREIVIISSRVIISRQTKAFPADVTHFNPNSARRKKSFHSFLQDFKLEIWFWVDAFQHSCVLTSPYLSLSPQGGGRRGVCNDVATFPVFKQTTSQNKRIHNAHPDMIM